MRSTSTLSALILIAALSLSVGAQTPSTIVQVSIPVGSQDAVCSPLNDNVYSVSTPIDMGIGIGHLIAPFSPWDLASYGAPLTLHDHDYAAPYVPLPSHAEITFVFDAPTTIGSLTVMQHQNGMTEVEGFVGNDLSSLTSIGSPFGTLGDVTGESTFEEGYVDRFEFPNPIAGTIFKVVVRKTNLEDGWANYRVYPCDLSGMPIAPTGTGSLGGGQANPPSARLEINGHGAGSSSGPFVVPIVPLAPLTFVWQGAPLMPIALVTGTIHSAALYVQDFGSIDIGTPPYFYDVAIVFDGAQMVGPLQLTTDTTGLLTQTFVVPIGMPPGTRIGLQGIMQQPFGTTVYGSLMTAAFRIDVW